jgi:hypothetical protein
VVFTRVSFSGQMSLRPQDGYQYKEMG